MTVSVYVAEVDEVMARAEKAGAKVLQPATDRFYGDRSGQFDVSPEEMARRTAELMDRG